MISSRPAAARRLGLVLISIQPVLHDVLIKLFGPQQSCGRLSGDTFSILLETADQALVEFVRPTYPGLEYRGIRLGLAIPSPHRDQAEIDRSGFLGGQLDAIDGSHFGPVHVLIGR